MRISLIVSTYNRPDALEVTLLSALRQTRLPDEIIVGDDGSGLDTAEVVRRIAAESPVPVIHVWHEDCGFRLAEIRNKCIARATGDYIVQVDGDIVLMPRFISDHESLARKGCFARGSRVRLSKECSERICRDKRLPDRIGVFSPGVLKDRAKAWRIPFLGSVLSHRRRELRNALGANMAFWREDLVRVNGYDNAFKGWGYEDTDMMLRLKAAGVKPFKPFRRALCLHLWHRENPNPAVSESRRYMEEKLVRGEIRAADGLEEAYRSLTK